MMKKAVSKSFYSFSRESSGMFADQIWPDLTEIDRNFL